MQLFNLHTHTNFSDGKSTAEEVVQEAIRQGLKILGFSDHSPVPFENSFAIKNDEVQNYIDTINSLKEKYKDQIKIYCSMEMDFIPGIVKNFKETKEKYGLDYLSNADYERGYATLHGRNRELYAAIDRLIFLHYLAFADEVRELAYRDAWGRMQNLTFNRYDFYRKNESDGSYTVDDGYLFAAEVGVASETGREAIWAKNLENFREGTLGDVTDPHTLCLYWQLQERAHYPYAEDQAEYFRRRLREREKEESLEQYGQTEIGS